MRGHVDGGRVILEMSAEELRALYIAVDAEVSHHLAESVALEDNAEDLEVLATEQRRGRVAARRKAGEFRMQAVGHRAVARQVTDIRRVLHQLTTNPEAR